jgi:DNA-binding CsgD family transcriptional regulator
MEKRIVKMLSHGSTAKEIADKLNLSHRTIEKRLELLRMQYKVKNTPHLVGHFFRLGIIK